MIHVLSKDRLPQLLSLWSEHCTVYAPHHTGQEVVLKKYTDTSVCSFDYINFPHPVPDFGAPVELFSWDGTLSTYTASPATAKAEKNIYFGVRPCDIAGLVMQDSFHCNEYTDPAYTNLRQQLIILALNCNIAGDACFCASTDTGPVATIGADIIVTELSSRFSFEPKTDTGQQLIEQAKKLFEQADALTIRSAQEELHAQALASFVTSVDLTHIEDVLAATYNDPLWERLAPDCIGCSGCTRLCPTCTCFQVIESAGSAQGTRIRCKDSCQAEGFTRNAGWHNPRTKAGQVRYRIYDKLLHIQKRFSAKGCVGCGRCTITCPTHINIVHIAKELIASWEQAKKPSGLRMAPARYEILPTKAEDTLYTPRPARITNIYDETKDIKRYFFEYCDAPDEPVDLSGQFYMLTVFGLGEIAISIPFGDAPGTKMEFCIKAVGKVTKALAHMHIGDVVGLRGPYGRGFDLNNFMDRDVLIVGSGVGLAPVRTAIVRMLDKRDAYKKLAVIASAFTYEGLVYKDDLMEWSTTPNVSVHYALAEATNKVDAHVGYINDLLPSLPFAWDTSAAILCASPRRIKFLASDLLELGMHPENIYTSLETHMRCGVGKCGHCKVGSHYMCVDGPVFTYKEMLELPPEF